MKFIKNIRKYIILSGVFFLLIISLFALATALIHKPGVQQYLLQKVCIGYGLETSTGKVELDIFGACGVKIHDVDTCRTDKKCSVTASSLTINFSKLRLLTGKLIPVSVDIEHPVIKISETDIKSFLNKGEGGSRRMPVLCRSGVNRFNIKDGELLIDGPSGFRVNSFSAILEHVEETSNTFKVSGSGRVTSKDKKSEFSIISTIDINPQDVLKSVFSAALKTENTPLAWVPESSKKIDFNKGLVNSDLNIIGDPAQGIRLGGTLNFSSAAFTLTHKGRSKKFNVPKLDCVLYASMKDQVIRIDSLNVKKPDLDIDLDMTIDLTNRADPYFRMAAKSKFMSVHTFNDNYPFPLTKSWLEDTLFPMFEDGIVRMDKLVLDGSVDQFRHIREKENHSIFEMHLTCKDFTVANMGLQIPVTGVTAAVDISNGSLKISGLSGIFGESEIKEGSLNVDRMIGGPPVFMVFAAGDFDIRELMSQRSLNVMPEKARLRIEEYSGLKGRLTTSATIGYQKGLESPWTIGGDFSFSDTLFHKRFLDLPLRFTQIDFHFPEEGGNTFSGQGSFGNTQFGITGITEFSESRLLIKHAGITADADMNQLVQRGLKSDKYKFRESLPVDITIDRQEEAYAYRGSLDAERLVLESEDIIYHAAGRGNSVSFDLLRHSTGKLDINSINARLGNSSLLLSGKYSLTDQKLNTLRIMSSDLSIGDLGIRFKGSENVLFGRLKGTLDFDFPGKGIKGMQINGNLTGDDISFIPGFLPLPISGCSFRLDLSGKNGFIDRLDMKFGEHPLHLKGILQGWDTLKGELLATADYFDLTDIVMKDRRVSAGKTARPEIALLKIYDMDLKLNASGGIWRKLEFKRLVTDINISDKNIKIKNAQAELETGDIAVNGTIGRTGSGKVDIEGRIKLDNQSVEKLISDTGFGDRGIKGTLSLKASVNIQGPKKNGLLKNLSGNIDSIHVTRGLIRNSRVFLKILDGLNIPDKFRQRPEDMRGEEGFYFHSIEGAGAIEKGILKTDNFIIKSPAFNAVGSGEENLYTQTHKLRLLLQPLTNLDYIISKIPVVGPILSDDDENETIFTVGYDVKGTWSKPDMDLVPSENLKSLGQLLKRAILTPVRLIENIGNASKKSMKKAEPEVLDGNETTEEKAPAEEEKP